MDCGMGANDPITLIFLLDKKKKLTTKRKDYLIFCHTTYGPTFGAGHDFTIGKDFLKTVDGVPSHSDLWTFIDPSNGITKYYLTGKRELSIKEVEVFSVKK